MKSVHMPLIGRAICVLGGKVPRAHGGEVCPPGVGNKKAHCVWRIRTTDPSKGP